MQWVCAVNGRKLLLLIWQGDLEKWRCAISFPDEWNHIYVFVTWEEPEDSAEQNHLKWQQLEKNIVWLINPRHSLYLHYVYSTKE